MEGDEMGSYKPAGRQANRWVAAGVLAGLLLFGSGGGVTADTAAIGFENGYTLPARGDMRVLVTFAEVNFRPCGGGFSQAPFAHENWPEGQPPLDKDQYYDPVIQGRPHAFMSDYYYQMSFGLYRVAGDYVPQAVTLDCRDGQASPDKVLAALNARGVLVTAHGLMLNDFDQWTPTGPGLPKIHQADGKVDVLMIVWRNIEPFNGTECNSCFTGYMSSSAYPIGNKSGSNAMGSFGAWGSGPAGWGIFMHEYMHTLFGGNNMHIGDGADIGSFHYTQSPWGMTGASPAASNVANGWDRDHLKWKPENKHWYISAISTGRHEVPSDISIATHPAGGVFILRDFVESGDAIRIRLPHITWEEFAPKNQYLWIENHQLHSRFDVNGLDVPCQSRWRPGVYAQVQVGKDTGAADLDHDGRVTANDLYPSSYYSWFPNAVGSWLLPLSADGRRDWLYRFDKATPPDPTVPCQWDNAGLPIERARSLPNAFTGYSDLFFSVDSDTMLSNPQPSPITLIPIGNGLLLSGEPKSVLTEVVGNTLIRSLGNAAEQAFSAANGKTRMSISTNPAPVPVYTRESRSAYASPNTSPIEDWENRTIWLNGLSVEVLQENVDGHGAVKVQIRWDDSLLDRDVRWTGNVVLDNDAADPWKRQAKVVVADGRNLYLDRGLSPTVDVAKPDFETIYPTGEASVYPAGLSPETGRLFTEPTVMTVKAGTKIHLGRGARLWIQNGSTLNVEPGAEVQLEPGADIVQGVGGGTQSIGGTIRRFGDLNGDACVDRFDLSVLLHELVSGQDDPFHDLNEDGHVDVRDALTLMRFFSKPLGRSCYVP
jgi:hypothetical protein